MSDAQDEAAVIEDQQQQQGDASVAVFQLQQWLSDNDIWLHPNLEIRERPQSQKGQPPSLGVYIKAHASGPIESETVIGTIPKSICLSPRNSSLALFLDDDDIFSPPSTTGLLLAMCLLYERLLGEQSPWHGYIRSLPCERDNGEWSISLPLEWSSDSSEGQWLHGTEVDRIKQRALNRQALPNGASQGMTRSNLLEYFRTVCLPILDRANAPYNCCFSTLESLFIGAYTLVCSRGFICDLYHGLVLCPLADLFNHSENNHVQFECDDLVCMNCGSTKASACTCLLEKTSSQSVTLEDDDDEEVDTIDMTVSRRIFCEPTAPGTIEVFNSYGDLSSAHLLSRYGFVPEFGTSQDRCCWDWSDESERQQVFLALFQGRDQVMVDDVFERCLKVASELILHDDFSDGEVARQCVSAKTYLDANAKSKEMMTRLTTKVLTGLSRYHIDLDPVLSEFLCLPGGPDSSIVARHDSDLSLFVDGQGRISRALFLLALCASVSAQGGEDSDNESEGEEEAEDYNSRGDEEEAHDDESHDDEPHEDEPHDDDVDKNDTLTNNRSRKRQRMFSSSDERSSKGKTPRRRPPLTHKNYVRSLFHVLTDVIRTQPDQKRRHQEQDRRRPSERHMRQIRSLLVTTVEKLTHLLEMRMEELTQNPERSLDEALITQAYQDERHSHPRPQPDAHAHNQGRQTPPLDQTPYQEQSPDQDQDHDDDDPLTSPPLDPRPSSAPARISSDDDNNNRRQRQRQNVEHATRLWRFEVHSLNLALGRLDTVRRRISLHHQASPR